jgi:3-phenylpropionate/trans-cinnamate dioxygenase ferredoxin subunit
MARHVVGAVDSFPIGSTTRVEVKGRAIAIFNVKGDFFALRDICPHQGASLSAGAVMPWVTSKEPGCFALDQDRRLVKCPWHGWEYELSTGQSWSDPENDRVKAYEVEVEHGKDLLEQGSGSGRVPGPFVAETVPIRVENDYVVLEV